MTQTASQRRFQKRAVDLGKLRTSDSARFARMWNTLYRGWINEIHARARAWRQGTSQVAHQGVFEVYEYARCLANEAGAGHLSLVATSLNDLQHLCALAVAAASDPHLYRFTEDCTARVRRCAGGWA